MADYKPSEIEPKWQKYWHENNSFETPGLPSRKKFYCLDMFPYPSGSGLHIGHPLGYTATDIYSRFKRMQGYDVLHPMGYDAFGLPAEQHAVKTGEHPSRITESNCDRFTMQMKALGLSYDWDRELKTCQSDYYHWTQWIFLQIYNSWFDADLQKARPIEELPIPDEVTAEGESAILEYQAQHRLAYMDNAMVNWCPGLGTVLANEEVIDGKSAIGGYDVIRKPMRQWMLRITAYSERLLNEIEDVDWPEAIKEQQRNWIGKRTGTEITFEVKGSSEKLVAFTTRPDTLFGVTFFVVSPEHPIVPLVTTADCKQKVERYCEDALKMSEFARTLENRTKTGVFTGAYVKNPISEELAPLYVGDYVLMSYGTGAVMGVPGHDERDFEFARKFQLEIRPVIVPEGESDEVKQAIRDGEVSWTKPGQMIDLDFKVMKELGLAGKPNEEAKELITSWLEERTLGNRVVNYRIRDWLFSRQRYWGEPIPVIHWEDGTTTALREDELPLLLPQVEDYKPSETGESPLAKAGDWLDVIHTETGKSGRRETNTMPQWAGSCWYYLRFIDPKNSEVGWDAVKEQKWMPVDLYVGGAEHAVLHLLYARFWHKIMHDLGHVSTVEPFQKLFNQGMIQSTAYKNNRGALVAVDEVIEKDDGTAVHKETGEELERITAKMSKSLRNVVNPDDVIAEYGADTLRTYLMFMGPLDQSRIWDSKAILGNFRFMKKCWNFIDKALNDDAFVDSIAESAEVKRALHQAIKKVTEDTHHLRFNTAISAMMECVNTLSGAPVSRETARSFVLLLAPYAPHLAEELWQRLGGETSLTYAPWPLFDENILKQQTATVVVQVNGKKRKTLDVDIEISEEDLRLVVTDALADSEYQSTQTDKFIVVYQKNTKTPKLVNVIQKKG